MRFVEVVIADSFPVSVLCLSDGTLMLQPHGNFSLIFDGKHDGVTGIFDSEGFALLEQGRPLDDMQDYQYNVPYEYKQMPVLKAWLVQQNLINPLG